METQETFGILNKMPEYYQKAYQENQELLEGDIFSGVNMSLILPESDQFKEMMHFLDMFVEIFNFNCYQNEEGAFYYQILGKPEIIIKNVSKFREIFRAIFSDISYLPLAKFKEIPEKAAHQTILSIPKENEEHIQELKRILALEQIWLEKINEKRRQKDLEVIKTEALEKFRLKIESEFNYLYIKDEDLEDSFGYCEDKEFQLKIRKMVIQAKVQFQQQIPFWDQEEQQFITTLLSEFELNLDQMFLTNLIVRNTVQMTKTHSMMDEIVKKCVQKYTDCMLKYLENRKVCKFEAEINFKEHQKLVQENLPKFILEKGEIGSKSYQITCLKNYWQFSNNVFQNLVKYANEDVKSNLELCKNESLDEVKKCLEKLGGIFEKFGMEPEFKTGFQSHMESCMEAIFAKVKEQNEARFNAVTKATKGSLEEEKTSDYSELATNFQRNLKLSGSSSRKMKSPSKLWSEESESGNGNSSKTGVFTSEDSGAGSVREIKKVSRKKTAITFKNN